MICCKSFNLTSNSSDDVIVSLHTVRRTLSYGLLILSLICLPWNIHASGQYLYCGSVKALKIISLFLNGRHLATLVKVLNFLLAFEQILATCLLNFNLLFDVISRTLTLLLSQTISLFNFAQICSVFFSSY